eukprot:351897-Chlamydomonas_euryale.AAC.3
MPRGTARSTWCGLSSARAAAVLSKQDAGASSTWADVDVPWTGHCCSAALRHGAPSSRSRLISAARSLSQRDGRGNGGQ